MAQAARAEWLPEARSRFASGVGAHVMQHSAFVWFGLSGGVVPLAVRPCVGSVRMTAQWACLRVGERGDG